MQTLFVYYKLPQSEHAHWAQRVRSFIGRVQSQFDGLDVDLMQRPEVNAQGLETWMEIYRHPQGVSQTMIDTIEAEALALALPSARASEVFIDLRA